MRARRVPMATRPGRGWRGLGLGLLGGNGRPSAAARAATGLPPAPGSAPPAPGPRLFPAGFSRSCRGRQRPRSFPRSRRQVGPVTLRWGAARPGNLSVPSQGRVRAPLPSESWRGRAGACEQRPAPALPLALPAAGRAVAAALSPCPGRGRMGPSAPQAARGPQRPSACS